MRSYLRDYAGWAEDTAQAILEQRWSDIDRAALADEVLDLGKRIESKMESRLRVLLAHLLKQRYQPERETRSWQLTIEEQRSRAWQLLDENPSLKPSLRKLYSRAYSAARYKAARETGLDLTTFPDDLVFTESEIWGEKTL